MKLIIHTPGHYPKLRDGRSAKYPIGTDIMLLVIGEMPNIQTNRNSIDVIMRAMIQENTSRLNPEKRSQIHRYLAQHVLKDTEYLLKLDWRDRHGTPLGIDTVKANLVLCEIGP